MDICDAEEIKKEIKEDIKPMPEEVSKLKELSSKNANSLINIDISSLEERTSVLKSIDEFGLDTIEKSSHKMNYYKLLLESYLTQVMKVEMLPMD